MPDDPFHVFCGLLPKYLQEVGQANSEASKALSFLTLVRRTFEHINADKPSKLIPQLERAVSVQAGTVMVRGRIDALLGNLVIELKMNLNEIRLSEAQDQLKKYVAALWAFDKQRTNYMLMATDGLRFRVYKPTALLTTQEVSPNDVRLEEVNLMDIDEVAPEDAFRWLDRYVLWRERIPPTTEEMVKDFGVGSPTFSAAKERLQRAWETGRESAIAPFQEWAKYLSLVYGSTVGDESLFLKHTYLATLAKLMVYSYYSSGAIPSRDEVKKVLSGEAFKEWGIENFLEEDFFSWLVRGKAEEGGLDFAWELLNVLERYDLSKLNEDVLKGLYQGLIDPETRHDLGEYYTPEWLAEWIVERLFADSTVTALDPACGSGTFLVAAIKKKKATIKIEPHLLLMRILASVKGFDVHPLAVLTSKANYLMAVGDIVKFKAGKFHIPVYLANSIDFPNAKLDVVHGVEAYQYPVSKKTSLIIPKDAINKAEIGELIESIAKFARMVTNGTLRETQTLFDDYLARQIPSYMTLESGAKNALWDTCKTLARLIRANKDTIYAFIIKNVYRPATIGHFDVVMGNPPWLSYRYVKLPDYQKKLKEMIIEKHKLLPSREAKLLTHMELATAFLARSVDVYLKLGGSIGFVMPRSIFTADHHQEFRMNAFVPKVHFSFIVDFDRSQQERLSPLFSVESCAILGVKGEKTEYPVKCLQLAGLLKKKNLSLAEFQALQRLGSVKASTQEIRIVRVGKRTSWSYEALEEIEEIRHERSPYMEMARQGATLVPRPFWFVRAISHPKLGVDVAAPFVETTVNASRMAKGAWTGASLNGKVESRFVFATLLGGDILPFAHLPFRLVVLPVITANGFKVLSSQDLKRAGHPFMREWMNRAEESWATGRGPKASRMTLVHWIDYNKKLSHQSPEWSRLLMYNTSGRRNLSACIVELPKPLVVQSNGILYQTSGFIAESSTYYIPIKKIEEGAYLAAFLNSTHTFELLRRIKAVRHVHKKVWELPLPVFNPGDSLHIKLAELGANAALVSAEIVAKEYSTGASIDALSTGRVGKIRQKLREAVGEQLAAIDDIVRQVLRRQ